QAAAAARAPPGHVLPNPPVRAGIATSAGGYTSTAPQYSAGSLRHTAHPEPTTTFPSLTPLRYPPKNSAEYPRQYRAGCVLSHHERECDPVPGYSYRINFLVSR